MTTRSFIDTNILVYTDDVEDAARRERALELLSELADSGRGVVSTQILQEYFAASTRKLRVSAERARQKVELFASFEVVLLTPDDILAAIDLHRLNRISFWDALVVHAAKRAGCSTILSEDLQAGRSVAGVRIENPFA